MKPKRKNRNTYMIMTVILIVSIAGVLFYYTKSVQKISDAQCFSMLDDSREQVAQMIANEMQNQQEHLESASNLLSNLIVDFDKNQGNIKKILSACSTDREYSHWEICLPDGSGMRDDGEMFDLEPAYSFSERIRSGFVVSERRTALKDQKTQIVMLSKCMFNDGKCVGILSSVIDVEAFSSYFFKSSYAKKLKLVLFERETGDILIDFWHDLLGNIKDVAAPVGMQGYDWDTIEERYCSGKKGHGAFAAEDDTEIQYLSYAPVGYSDWELLVVAPGSIYMKPARENRRQTFEMLATIISLFLIYLLLLAYCEQARQEENQQRELELEDALRKAKHANEAKSDFLSRMSHDIRTPLNGIIGLMDISEANSSDTVLLRENRQKARIAANHLLSLINDILNMSKLEDDKVEFSHEAFDLCALADDVLTITRLNAEEAGIALVHENCAENLPYPYVYGSPLHVRQIFVNVLSNAIKYNKPGGSIYTKITCEQTGEGTVTYSCVVKDTGIGMSKEFLVHLFEPFAQEKVDARSVYQGTGLGMAIVKSLVDKMGGTITVKSEVEIGTEFLITLTFDIASKEDVYGTEEQTPEASIKGMHILLAEDNDLNREIATELLKEQGAKVSSVVDGAQAVKLFGQCEQGTFDAVLMDIMMPVCDGLEACRRIRSLNREDAKKVPVIALTANAFLEDAKKCEEAGMDAYLTKPIELNKLIATLSKIRKTK